MDKMKSQEMLFHCETESVPVGVSGLIYLR